MTLAFRPGTLLLDATGAPLVVVAGARNVMIYDPENPAAVREGILLCSLETGALRYVSEEEQRYLAPTAGTTKSFKRRRGRGHPRVQAFTSFARVRGWTFQEVATAILDCSRAHLHACLSEYKPLSQLRRRVEQLAPYVIEEHPWQLTGEDDFGFEASKNLVMPQDYSGERKACSICGEPWPATEVFYAQSRAGASLTARCLDCTRTYSRHYYGRRRRLDNQESTT